MCPESAAQPETEYQEFVRSVIAGAKAAGMGPREASNYAIQTDVEIATGFDATLYNGEPVVTERISPREVIENSRVISASKVDESFYEQLARCLLAADMIRVWEDVPENAE